MAAATLGAAGIGAIGSLFGGGDGPSTPLSDLHLVNPGQQALWNMLQQRAMGGAGEFGYGQAAKQAKGQVQQMLADRGVDMGSGFAAGAMGNAFSNAAAQDQAARNQFNLNLLNTPLQVAQASGKNYIPGSPSYSPFGVGTNGHTPWAGGSQNHGGGKEDYNRWNTGGNTYGGGNRTGLGA
jgi:hypothetical protein